jgi:hypothetical protein
MTKASLMALLLSVCSAQIYFDTTQNSTKCIGTYSDDINTLFIDCIDQLSGQYVSRDEWFYEYTLDSKCSSATLEQLMGTLQNWDIP